MGIRSSAIELIRNRKVEMNSMSKDLVIFTVDKETVLIKKLAGRSVISCSCRNHAMFPNQSLCKHKIAALFAWTMKGIR